MGSSRPSAIQEVVFVAPLALPNTDQSYVLQAAGSSVASAPVSSFPRASVTPSSQDICR